MLILRFELQSWHQLFYFFQFTIKNISKYKLTLLNQYMNKDRAAQIRLRQEENRKLEDQTKRMEQELQKIRKIKQMENQRIKLQLEMKELDLNQDKKKKIIADTTNLRGYGTKVAKKNQQKVQQKIKKLAKQLLQSSQSQDQNKDEDGENVRYFLEVMGMEKYFPAFKENKILTLQKLKAVKQPDLKKLLIPIKDMVVINKKLRTMGIN